MKRMISVVLVAVAIIFSFALPLLAEEVKEDKVTGSVTFKNDWSFPSSGDSFDMQHLSTYFHYKFLGAGLDVDYGRKADYLQVKPYLTLNKGPWYLVGGGSYR